MTNDTDKNKKIKIQKMLLAYRNFKQTIRQLGGRQKKIIEQLNKKLDQAKIEAILKKLKQK
jgi:hypothetical protein